MLPQSQCLRYARPFFTSKLPVRNFSIRKPLFARYVRFSPDPERPLDVRKWDTGTKVVGGLVVLAGVYYVTHLEQVPETGRWRFMDISAKYEAKLAEAARAELASSFENSVLPPAHPLTLIVRGVVGRILESNNLGTMATPAPFIPQQPLTVGPDSGTSDAAWNPDEQSEARAGAGEGSTKEWSVMVVNDPKTINAMASFGTVVVFTGILPVCEDEDGIAAVLGHEIAHVVARHSSERYSSMKVLLGIALLLETLGLDWGLARFATSLLLDLPNSRAQETEADTIGIRLMARACFDPAAASQVFRRLGALEGKRGNNGLEFLRTHPGSEKRSQRLESLLPEAYEIQAASECRSMSVFREAAGLQGGRSGVPVW